MINIATCNRLTGNVPASSFGSILKALSNGSSTFHHIEIHSIFYDHFYSRFYKLYFVGLLQFSCAFLKLRCCFPDGGICQRPAAVPKHWSSTPRTLHLTQVIQSIRDISASDWQPVCCGGFCWTQTSFRDVPHWRCSGSSAASYRRHRRNWA